MGVTGNPNWLLEGFVTFLQDSKIVNVMFSAAGILAVVLYTIAMVKLYADKNIKDVRFEEIVRPFIVILIIIFWKWIYYDILNDGFNALLQIVIGKVQTNANQAAMQAEINKTVVADSISFISISVEAFIMYFLRVGSLIINTIIDFVLAAYICVNDLVLAIVAPFAITFSIIKLTQDMFNKWLVMFFFFKIFLIVVIGINQLSVSIQTSIAATAAKYMGISVGGGLAGDIGKGAVAVAGMNAIAVISILALVVFKILFITVLYATLKVLFTAGDTGLGSGTAGIASSVKSGVATVLTKGTSDLRLTPKELDAKNQKK